MELKAIAMIELNSIAKGVHVGDEMLKTADVELVMAQPICAGKYMVLVSGDVDSVERASEVGKETAGEFLVDDFVIPINELDKKVLIKKIKKLIEHKEPLSNKIKEKIIKSFK